MPPVAGAALALPVCEAAALELGPGLDTVWDPHATHAVAVMQMTAKAPSRAGFSAISCSSQRLSW